MAIRPAQRNSAHPHGTSARCRLVPATTADAWLVASWLADPHDAYWAAPRTWPPVTAQRVRTWFRAGHRPYLLTDDQAGQSVGYGELNTLRHRQGDYWIGHLVVDPQQRGRGYGLVLTLRLLERAFAHQRARRVLLVVFPENVTAIRCYQRAGMRPDGYELHHFPPYDRCEHLLKMVITREQWEAAER